MPITNNYINGDSNGNEWSQYETNDATNYLAQSRFTPQEKEAGMLYIFYNAVNTSTGASVNKVKAVQYKMVSGVTTLPSNQTLWAPTAGTGMTTVDAVVSVQGADVVIQITGIAGATVRHSLKVERLSSQLKQ